MHLASHPEHVAGAVVSRQHTVLQLVKKGVRRADPPQKAVDGSEADFGQQPRRRRQDARTVRQVVGGLVQQGVGALVGGHQHVRRQYDQHGAHRGSLPRVGGPRQIEAPNPRLALSGEPRVRPWPVMASTSAASQASGASAWRRRAAYRAGTSTQAGSELPGGAPAATVPWCAT